MIMNAEFITQTIIFFFTAAALWIMYQWLYKDFATDFFRQKMFVLRDELFDEAAAGLISFDHQAYCTLRRTMNGSIRFGHKLSVFEVVILAYRTRKDPLLRDSEFSFSQRLEEVSGDLDAETKQRLAFYKKRIGQLLATHLLLMSPLLILSTVALMIGLVVPCLVMLFLRRQIEHFLKKLMQQNLSNIESAALAVGRS